MNYDIQSQQSTEALRERIAAAVSAMDQGDLSHYEENGLLVADTVVAENFFKDSRYRHIGMEDVGQDKIHVFLFVRAEQ